MEKVNIVIETYWCFNCNKEIKPKFSEGCPICNLCGSTFVEEIEQDGNKTDDPKNFIPQKNKNYSGINNNLITSSQPLPQTNNINNRMIFIQMSRNPNGEVQVISNQGSNNVQQLTQHFNNLFNSNSLIGFNPFNFTNGYLNNLSNLQNNAQPLENLLNYLMMNDPNRYGNPPASKKTVDALPRIKLTLENIKEFQNLNCPLCMEDCVVDEVVIKLKCSHSYHDKCIIEWLKASNTCPICRDELLTDDEDYENRKNQRRQMLRNYPNVNNTQNTLGDANNLNHPNRHSQG